ncbi:hypothetical protein Pcar_2929 [Syntrophotalea carbinolica DSM 2380]|uniref:Uncharacterized protein n=1 Tax=Syntrophotalea carbinolica (strain DSM 2380 / NBRC 103641 / GraBd1) TaxID=338963 RepID=Q3A0E3_SYNC1|nr:hypothetical protein [Syntrophotalea carbinolica]ABA90164.2 hypothetical protein Pcar_2929 [Syntrophotalea carbinolica DSM 2380]
MNLSLKKPAWPTLLSMSICGGLSAWLTLDEKSASAIFGFIGPIVGAVLVITLFAILIVGILAYLVSLSRP